MPIELEPGDIEFLKRIDSGARIGDSQSALAESEDLTMSQLRHRLQKLGFEFHPVSMLRSALGKRPLRDLIENRELVAAGNSADAARDEVAA